MLFSKYAMVHRHAIASLITAVCPSAQPLGSDRVRGLPAGHYRAMAPSELDVTLTPFASRTRASGD